MLPVIARGAVAAARTRTAVAAETKAANEARGIQNAEVRYRKLAKSRLTEERLRQKKDPGALLDAANDATYAANDPYFDEETGDKETGRQEHSARSRQRGASAVSKLSSLRAWAGISVAFFSYLIQFLFGFLSLAIFQLYEERSVFVSVAVWIANFLGLVPNEEWGLVLWLCATVVALITYMGFYAWYVTIGINPMRTPLATFVMFFLVGSSLLPVGNLFPGVLVWVILTNLSPLFSKQ